MFETQQQQQKSNKITYSSEKKKKKRRKYVKMLKLGHFIIVYDLFINKNLNIINKLNLDNMWNLISLGKLERERVVF